MKTRKLALGISIGIASLLLYGCATKWGSVRLKDNTICTNYSNETISTLPVPLVHDMINKYKMGQLATIENGIMKNGKKLEDAHSIWFDLETLKKFIYQIENETIKKDNTKSSKELGIRIYYSAYPEKEFWTRPGYDGELNQFLNHPEKRLYGKHHTLMMIPTRKEGDLNIDFNPLDKDSYSKSLKELPRYLRRSYEFYLNKNNIPVQILSVSGSSNPRTSDQNHGSLIPPRDPGLNEEGF